MTETTACHPTPAELPKPRNDLRVCKIQNFPGGHAPDSPSGAGPTNSPPPQIEIASYAYGFLNQHFLLGLHFCYELPAVKQVEASTPQLSTKLHFSRVFFL